MAGLIGVVGTGPAQQVDRSFLLESVDLLHRGVRHEINMDTGFLALAEPVHTVLQGPRYHETSEFAAVFAGDLIERTEIPWKMVHECCSGGNLEPLQQMNGRFALAVYDKAVRRVHLVSDHRSQYPLYYYLGRDTLVFSTAVATFVRWLSNPAFSVDWLHDFIFFNTSFGSSTFVQGVKRMPAATVLTFDLDTAKVTDTLYAKPFDTPVRLAAGRESLNRLTDALAGVIPRYFAKGHRHMVSITGGLDARTVLAFTPTGADYAVETFTYGIPGCRDLREGSVIASALGFAHREIHFDRDFITRLPELFRRVVWLADGLMGVHRAAALYAYESLSEGGRPPVALTGSSADSLFRGHLNIPSIMSEAAGKVFRFGHFVLDRQEFAPILGTGLDRFMERVEHTTKLIEHTYGPLSSARTHLSLAMYEFAPRHFEGEARIADEYVTYRSPFYDQRLLQVAYEIEHSTMRFSKFTPTGQDHFRESQGQCHAIKVCNPRLAAVPLKGTPIAVYASGIRPLFELYRVIRAVKRRIKPVHIAPLEHWDAWVKDPLGPEFERLLGGGPMIAEYIDGGFINRVLSAKNTHWLRKLATAEMLMQLVHNRWRLE